VSGRRLVLVRHGITDWNREGRWQGQLDPPLSDTGRQEAGLVAERIARDDLLRPARIVASSLARARETAEVIGEVVGIRAEPEVRLMEIGAGEWEGRTHDELEATDGERYRTWRSSPESTRPPGGEPIDEATARVRTLLGELDAAVAWPILLVSHGGTLRIMARLLFGLGDDRGPDLDVDNASISAATRDGAAPWRLERWNDVLHLLGRTDVHVDEAEGRPLAL
jgi:glucosyl-3-phosphoglycerate phosphatase